MGDLSNEPSMEEILSSIKRIIAEEGETPNGRPRRQPRAAPAPAPVAAPAPAESDEDEVLELSHPISAAPEPEAATPEPEPAPAPTRASPPPAAPEPIVSEQTAQATRGALGQLSRLLVKPEPGNDGTLEGLVRDMLRPMLRDWLDANLPQIVQDAVAREITKITGLPPR